MISEVTNESYLIMITDVMFYEYVFSNIKG
jgi:hypothetical protein